jgi:class 3 adenylate cyclase
MNNLTGKLNDVWSFKKLSAKQITGRVIFFAMILSALAVGAICFRNALQWVDKPFPGFLLNQRMVVGLIGHYYWTGTEAGLKNPDKIIKINDQVVSSTKDLEKIIQSTKIGYPVRYSVERDGQIFEVTIPTMRFTWKDLLMTFGIISFLAFLYLIIGGVVFILKPDTIVSWVFLLGCFLQGISSFVSFDLESTHFGFVRAYLFDEAFLPAVVLHLSLLFPEKSILVKRYPYAQLIPYIISTILFIPLELYYPQPSFIPVYKVVLLYVVISVIALIVSILQAYIRKSSALSRQRAKVVLLGAAFAFPFPVIVPFITFMGISLKEIPLLTNFTSIPILIFPASIAYAIAKHNLFDVDVYVKRAVGYGIMVALIVMLEFSTHILSEKVLSHIFGEYAEKVFPILFVLLIVLTFNPVYHKVREFVDKLFFRKKFDYKDTILFVSNALTSVLNLDEIVKRIIYTVRKVMFIDTAGVILLEPQKKCCQMFFIGDKPDNIEDHVKDVCIPCNDPLFGLISREKKLITRYDIEEDPHYGNLKESCRQRFSEIGASMVMPLIYQNEVKGAFALGYKKSGHFYTREDIDLLETLTNHGAIAIENARLAEQMEKEVEVRADLARYLSPQVVEQVVKKDMRVDLEGHKKVVTVLISDIRNFIKITETYSPEQLVHILNEYFTEMSKIIFENQGSLDKYIGDAIVAVFGSLIPLENPAQSAVIAASQMMKCMPSLNEKWMRHYELRMDIGIGINTGEVFLGNVGSPERMEFTVIGDTVNVASRLSDLAQAGQILITRNTFACLGSDILCRELPTVMVKGKREKQEVFEILYS